MQFFPKVHSPCPYKGALSDIMDGDVCRLCKREVHDLTGMAEDAKRALFEGCADEICVTYRIDTRPALAALAIGAGVMAPTALAAREAAPVTASPASAVTSEDFLAEDSQLVIIVGGARPAAAEWQSEEQIRQAHPQRTLPVVYEDEPAGRTERSGQPSGESPKRA